MPRSGIWQNDHIFVLIGPGAFDRARSLYRSGQCQPAIPVPDNASLDLYSWPVTGLDVTVKNFGTSVDYAEDLLYRLLNAGARLVVHVDAKSGHVSIHRPDELQNAA